jgi:hypothetical protein
MLTIWEDRNFSTWSISLKSDNLEASRGFWTIVDESVDKAMMG